jgi:probable rRNA maturation factor
MEIDVLIEEGAEGCPDAGWLRGIAEKALHLQGVGPDAEMGLVITGQEKVRELNRLYRDRDEPTDVLAFFMIPEHEKPDDKTLSFVTPPDGLSHLGEVVISYPTAVAQAKENRHSVNRELAVLIIHGVLHLLGYDHETPEQRHQMQSMEKEILSSVEEALG